MTEPGLADTVARQAGPALGGLSYAALADRVARVAGGLRARGVRTGDRVAVLAHNQVDTLVLLLACDRLGAIMAPLNWRLAAPELQWILDDLRPAFLLVDTAHATADLGVPLLTALPEDTPVAAGGDPALPLLLIYTSGTTGRPKGAVLTGRALLANAVLSRDMHGLTAEDHVLTVLPLFHVGGLNIQTVPALLTGARVTLHARFDAGAALAAIARDRPTLTVLVPSTLAAMIEHADWATTDLTSLRAVTTGSTNVPQPLVDAWEARGVPVLQVYGSTETCPIAIYTRHHHRNAARPGPGTEARIAAGRTGEILLRGPQIFSHYWNNPAATAEAMRDGWFHTGDIGTVMDDAWMVHDRLKNLIISGGENIYPAEIERVLREHPAVLDAAVVGRPDPRWQQVPVAHVQLRAPCTEAALLDHIRGQLARFKVPREVRFVPDLPRNALGKVQHALLPP